MKQESKWPFFWMTTALLYMAAFWLFVAGVFDNRDTWTVSDIKAAVSERARALHNREATTDWEKAKIEWELDQLRRVTEDIDVQSED